ncbi:hypothetical protein EDM54_24180 [Brevibacillus borstelensis]|uniref:hypothetical protein n=1 Tax=Brevibacillus borstelensis TaxID=45462 RepID=UPI00057BE9F2|nr:hypothetical protein [Brevibacillus borstelensis]MED1885960.1 hypothetical protein [Brevibacillus borstelensis]RNB56090.1 hypothetical protein EDM54_24180 [Brevibacillus borstelensis]GED55772.1 hypothetical protein BBO01nite_50130 [Brevibacillus borstelensis]
MSKQLLEKLERYEQDAYSGGYGADWLAEVGEGFKDYIGWCVENKKRPSIKGFEEWIDQLYNK